MSEYFENNILIIYIIFFSLSLIVEPISFGFITVKLISELIKICRFLILNYYKLYLNMIIRIQNTILDLNLFS